MGVDLYLENRHQPVDASQERTEARREVAEHGEFYAGWNAAIRVLRAAADAQGWWLPESVDKLIVK